MSELRVERALKRGQRLEGATPLFRDGFVELPFLADDGKRVAWARFTNAEWAALPKLPDPPDPDPDPDPAVPVLELSADAKAARVKGATGQVSYARAAGDEPAEASDYTTLAAGDWYPGTAEKPWVGGSPAGGPWSKRVKTTQAAPTPTPDPLPATDQPIGIGYDGGYGMDKFDEMIAAGIKHFRNHNPAAVEYLQARGGVCDVFFDGEGGSIASINAAAYAANAKALVQKYKLTRWEVLNEPEGEWFWPDTARPEARENFVRVAKATYEAVHPLGCKVLVSFEPRNGWAAAIKQLGVLAYCDEVVVHPYGGTTKRAPDLSFDKAEIVNAHTSSGKRVFVTELGWPTAVGQPPTGDSAQHTEEEQVANIQAFAAWMKANPSVVSGWHYFGYDSYGTNMWYGIVRKDGSRKPSYQALADIATR